MNVDGEIDEDAAEQFKKIKKKLDTPFERSKKIAWARLVSPEQSAVSDFAWSNGDIPPKSDSEEGEDEWYTADERTNSSPSIA